MFDKHKPFLNIEKQSFTFTSTRYEIWFAGKMISSGKTSASIVANVVTLDGKEKMEIKFSDNLLYGELAMLNVFDEFVTSSDRLQLITIPAETNSECVGIVAMQSIIGPTRQSKNFSKNEPYCCNLFTLGGAIAKITFSFSNPEKLIEFYYEPEDEDAGLDFVFESSDHLRYENGILVSGPHGGAKRAVKVEPNINGNEGYSVSMYNLDGPHPVWQNNMQMAPKQMKVVESSIDRIILKGFGQDSTGVSFTNYGLTINLKNGQLYNCVLHLYDRAVDIVYLP